MPFNYIMPTGVVVPDTSTLKTEVQGEFSLSFGPALLLADDTPQGRLIDVETTARDLVIRGAAELSNQFNPNFNSGIFLKSICALHAVEAGEDTYTVVPEVVITALPTTVIPAGSRVSDAAGNFYKAVTQLVADANGDATGSFQALQPGPTVPEIGSLNRIVDGTYGWLTVSNPVAAIPGSLEEDDNVLRLARNAKLFLLSKGPIEAIMANVLTSANVRWLTYRENNSAVNATIDGVVMPPSSTWICVQGGADDDIVMGILRSKQTGSPLTAGMNNGTLVQYSVVEPLSGQTYPAIFTRPDVVPVLVRVTVGKGSAIDPFTAVPDAALNYANGKLAGERGFVVGTNVSPFELAAAINIQLPELFIKKVEVSLASAPAYSTNEVEIALWEYASLTTGAISVVVV